MVVRLRDSIELALACRSLAYIVPAPPLLAPPVYFRLNLVVGKFIMIILTRLPFGGLCQGKWPLPRSWRPCGSTCSGSVSPSASWVPMVGPVTGFWPAGTLSLLVCSVPSTSAPAPSPLTPYLLCEFCPRPPQTGSPSCRPRLLRRLLPLRYSHRPVHYLLVPLFLSTARWLLN